MIKNQVVAVCGTEGGNYLTKVNKGLGKEVSLPEIWYNIAGLNSKIQSKYL